MHYELSLEYNHYIQEYTGDSLVAPTTMWCSDPDEYVDIELITLPGGSNQGHIRLEVTAVMTYNGKFYI